MTLPYSTVLNNQPTYFVEKISKGIDHYPQPLELSLKSGYDFNTLVYINCKPKIHTLRSDEKNRWEAGKLIHSVINNRTSKRFQFVPDLPCISTQKVFIRYWYNPKTELFDAPIVVIDDKELTRKEIDLLAVNDGFNNRAEFFQYFNENWEGKLIHWTHKKY